MHACQRNERARHRMRIATTVRHLCRACFVGPALLRTSMHKSFTRPDSRYGVASAHTEMPPHTVIYPYTPQHLTSLHLISTHHIPPHNTPRHVTSPTSHHISPHHTTSHPTTSHPTSRHLMSTQHIPTRSLERRRHLLQHPYTYTDTYTKQVYGCMLRFSCT